MFVTLVMVFVVGGVVFVEPTVACFLLLPLFVLLLILLSLLLFIGVSDVCLGYGCYVGM